MTRATRNLTGVDHNHDGIPPGSCDDVGVAVGVAVAAVCRKYVAASDAMIRTVSVARKKSSVPDNG
jgi:hypothetical protein